MSQHTQRVLARRRRRTRQVTAVAALAAAFAGSAAVLALPDVAGRKTRERTRRDENDVAHERTLEDKR